MSNPTHKHKQKITDPLDQNQKPKRSETLDAKKNLHLIDPKLVYTSVNSAPVFPNSITKISNKIK